MEGRQSELQGEIQDTMERLKSQVVGAGSAEAAALVYLRAIARSLSGPPHRLESRIAELRRFWLESVPWCSPLSKDLEKIIILYSEAVEDERYSHQG